MDDDLSQAFQPVSISGTIRILGEDGRTCEVEIHDILLDRKAPNPVETEISHTPRYESLGFQQCVANPVTGLGVKLAVDSFTGEKLFTATFRPPAEGAH